MAKKIWILVETNEAHDQKLEIYGTSVEAEIAIRKAFLATLSPDTRLEDEDDFYRAHIDWAWMSGDVSASGWEYDWRIYERELEEA